VPKTAFWKYLGMTTNLSVKLNEAFAHTQKPGRDYVSPGFTCRDFAEAFPHRIAGDKQNHPWVFLRREVDHGWYVDDRNPLMGFLSVDESSILHTLALAMPQCEALEIGCHRGWSTAHLAAGVKTLDVVDPVLADAAHMADVESSLARAGVRDQCNLYGATSPAKVLELLKERGRPWSFIFVDGDHEPDGPLWDAQTVANCATRDAIIVFHDLASPVVAEGLAYLRSLGWSCMVFQTMQIMGVAWRGNVKIPVHIPDPKVSWTLPDHLRTFMVSGETPAAYAQRLQKFFMDFTSHDPYARAKAPLLMGMPTQNALPTDVRKLQEELQAARDEASATKRTAVLDELSTLLTAERARADELESRLAAEIENRAAELKNLTDQSEKLSADGLHSIKRSAELEAWTWELTQKIKEKDEALEQLQAQMADIEARYHSASNALEEKSAVADTAKKQTEAYAELHARLESLLKSRRFLTRKLAARMLNR
jgi:hypothetical protein